MREVPDEEAEDAQTVSRERIGNLLQELVQEMKLMPYTDGKAMVTNWLLIGEAIDDDGDECWYAVHSDGAKVRTQLGLLDFAHMLVAAEAMQRLQGGD